MSQAQVDEVKAQNGGDFEGFNIIPNRREVHCEVDEHLQLIVKRIKQKPMLVLVKGSRGIIMPVDTFERLCDLNCSVSLLHAFLDDDTSKETTNMNVDLTASHNSSTTDLETVDKEC